MARVRGAETADHAVLEHSRTLLHAHPNQVTIPNAALASGQTERRLYDRFGGNEGLLARVVDHEIMGIMSDLTVSVVNALSPETQHLSRSWAVRLASMDQRRAIVAACVTVGGLDRLTAWALLSACEWACEERPGTWELRRVLRSMIDRLLALSFRVREETDPGVHRKR
jgi:hypothetical protein